MRFDFNLYAKRFYFYLTVSILLMLAIFVAGVICAALEIETIITTSAVAEAVPASFEEALGLSETPEATAEDAAKEDPTDFPAVLSDAKITVNAVTEAPVEDDETYLIDDSDPWAFALNSKRNYLTIVGVQNVYRFDGDYDLALKPDLVTTFSAKSGNKIRVERATYVAFSMLKDDLAAKGLEIGLSSAYRSKTGQDKIYQKYASDQTWPEHSTAAIPSGFSEHHTGLLLSVSIKENGEWLTETADQTNPSFQLLHETLADYGFIDRYPAGKESYTRVDYAPYAIRFVGSSHTAHLIMDNGLCLEEYLTHRNKYK